MIKLRMPEGVKSRRGLAKVWLVHYAPQGRHDLLMPARREFRRCFSREVSNTCFEVEPELRPVNDVHRRLAARANPLVKAPSQSAAAAGRAGPLFRASFTHA